MVGARCKNTGWERHERYRRMACWQASPQGKRPKVRPPSGLQYVLKERATERNAVGDAAWDHESWTALRKPSAPTGRSAVKCPTAWTYRNGRRFRDAIKGTRCISHDRHIFFFPSFKKYPDLFNDAFSISYICTSERWDYYMESELERTWKEAVVA
jgi:hypothetical protein